MYAHRALFGKMNEDEETIVPVQIPEISGDWDILGRSRFSEIETQRVSGTLEEAVRVGWSLLVKASGGLKAAGYATSWIDSPVGQFKWSYTGNVNGRSYRLIWHHLDGSKEIVETSG